ncbi:MAG: hypothetical protein JNL01_15515 [Bdellovibrionales bacterium]|nr:hypothetical protein [Bdellovibrionales bacterium]
MLYFRFLSLSALILSLTSAQALSDDSWRPDFNTRTGEFEFVFGLPSEMRPLKVSRRTWHAKGMAEVEALFPKEKSFYTISSQERFEVSFYTQEPNYDEAKLTAVREQLLNDLRLLAPDQTLILGKSFFELYDELKLRSAEQPNRADFFTKDLKRLLRLSPLLFDANGEARDHQESLSERIRALTPSALQSLYLDGYRLDLRNSILLSPWIEKARQLKDEFPKIDQQWVEKTIIPATTALSKSGEPLSQDQYVFEIAPPQFTVLRSEAGQDCSSDTIPFYGLHPDVRVFWIYPSARQDLTPIGYVLLLEVKHKGKVIPYVITLNGSNFSTDRTRKVLQSIANHYQTQQILVSPDEADHVVNTDAIRDGFNSFPGAPVKLREPKQWEKIGKIAKKHNHHNRNYYRWKGNLSEPRLVEVQKEIEYKSLPRIVRYPKVVPSQISKFEKAMYVARNLKPPKTIKYESEAIESRIRSYNQRNPGTQKALELSNDVLSAAYQIHETPGNIPETYKNIVEHFEINPEQLSKELALNVRTELAAYAYQTNPRQVPIGGWKNWFDSLFQENLNELRLKGIWALNSFLKTWHFPAEVGHYKKAGFLSTKPWPKFVPKDYKILISEEADERLILFEMQLANYENRIKVLEVALPEVLKKVNLLSPDHAQDYIKRVREVISSFRPRGKKDTELLSQILPSLRTLQTAAILDEAFIQAIFLRSKLAASTFSEIFELRESGKIGPWIDDHLMNSVRDSLQLKELNPDEAQKYLDRVERLKDIKTPPSTTTASGPCDPLLR